MPYPETHLKLTAYGDCYQQTEFWQWSIRARVFGTPTEAQLAQVAVEFGDQIATFYASGNGNSFCDSHRFVGVKAALINPAGEYPAGVDAQVVEQETPVVGALDAVAIPQVALVVSTMTPETRGLAHTGRFYLAGMRLNLGDDGLIGVGGVDPILAGLVTALNGTSAGVSAILDQWRVYSNVGAGASNPITYLRAGRVLDTHQSRRRSLPESYVTSNPIT